MESMRYFQERFNKNAQVFNIDFRLKTNMLILFITKHAKFWLVSKKARNWTDGFQFGVCG